MSNDTPIFDPNQDPAIYESGLASLRSIKDPGIRAGAEFVWRLSWNIRTLKLPVAVMAEYVRQDQRQRGGQPMDPLQVQ